jgi:sorting nexin-25
MFAGPAMIEQIIQRLSQQAADYAGIGGGLANDEDVVSQTVFRTKSSISSSGGYNNNNGSGQQQQLATPVDWRPLGGEGLTYFTTPICDLFIELFQLKEKNNWLRKQAIVIILQQVLGGTIERSVCRLTSLFCLALPSLAFRKFRDGLKGLLASPSLVGIIGQARDTFFPGGRLRPPSPPRTAQEKAKTRDAASQKLATLMPGVWKFAVKRE